MAELLPYRAARQRGNFRVRRARVDRIGRVSKRRLVGRHGRHCSPLPHGVVEDVRGCGSLRGRMAGADRGAARSIGAPGGRETWPYARSVSSGVYAGGWNLGGRPSHRAQNAHRWRPTISSCKRRDGVLMKNVTTVAHPLVQHKLTLMRDKTTSTKGFPHFLREIATFLSSTLTRDLILTPF